MMINTETIDRMIKRTFATLFAQSCFIFTIESMNRGPSSS